MLPPVLQCHRLFIVFQKVNVCLIVGKDVLKDAIKTHLVRNMGAIGSLCFRALSGSSDDRSGSR